ncbi:lipopolysaccharide kinase InaA family protein [uncultured Halopseudomonas sp.]|uniref:lipopolysaccharide kinase InaA family protein n=1 Tax=uncultured Halopseudomonas sp. TaxID=2901193 RepID=UPI0030ED1F9F|tara:strand:+ start:54349 stop:55116 length:768 start_codon:yes stop_codon:yes gene_type:complete
MTSPAFIAVNARDVLARHGLDSFDSLWRYGDAENGLAPSRGKGWKKVVRIELEDANGAPQSFYLKRQDHQLARSFRHPLGEPTFAREFRAIQHFAHQGIPALEAAFFAQRCEGGHKQAILLTRALDIYKPLTWWFERWQTLAWRDRQDLILAAAALVRSLHNAERMHNSLYPRHIFLKLDADGAGARLIDLVETRHAWFGERDRVRDLRSLLRKSHVATPGQKLRFLLAYTGKKRLTAYPRNLLSQLLTRAGLRR